MPFLKLFIFLTLALAAFKDKAQSFNSEIVLSGKYEMKIQIKDTLFVDYLTFNCHFSWSQPCTSVLLEPQRTTIRGQIEVPNIFIAPLKKGIIAITENPRKVSIEFEILAKENDQEFKVYYKAEIPESLYEEVLSGRTPPTFKGIALLDDNKQLGEFTAAKIE